MHKWKIQYNPCKSNSERKRKTVRVGEGLRYQSRSIERFNLPCFKKLIVTDFSDPLIYGEVQIYLFHQKR